MEHAPEAMEHAPAGVDHPPAAVQHAPAGMQHAPEAVGRPPEEVGRPPAVERAPAAVERAPPAVDQRGLVRCCDPPADGLLISGKGATFSPLHDGLPGVKRVDADEERPSELDLTASRRRAGIRPSNKER